MYALGFIGFISSHEVNPDITTTAACLSSSHIWFFPNGKKKRISLTSLVMLSYCSITSLTAAVPLSHPLWLKNVAWGFELEKPDDHHSFYILVRAFS